MAVSQGKVKIFVVRSHGGSVHSFQTCGNREELPFFLVLMIGKKKVDIFKTFHEDKVNIPFTVQLGFFWPFHAQMQLFRLWWCYPCARHVVLSGTKHQICWLQGCCCQNSPTGLSLEGRGCLPTGTCHAVSQEALHRTSTVGGPLWLQVYPCAALQELIAWLKWHLGTWIDPTAWPRDTRSSWSPVHLCSNHPCCGRYGFPKWDSFALNSMLAKIAWHSLYITSREVFSGLTILISMSSLGLESLLWFLLIFRSLISECLGDKKTSREHSQCG